MREIKFRYVFKKPSGHILIYHTDIQHLEKGDIGDFLQFNLVSIDRDLVSRDLYTGLHDKNGKEIYEGDILEYRDDRLAISWDAKHGCCNANYIINKSEMRDLFPFEWAKAVVIGNIYENSEFLEEK